jgi:hypothetical protein
MPEIHHAPTTLDALKLEAKHLKRKISCTPHQALNITAQNLGYADFKDAWWRITEREYSQRSAEEYRKHLAQVGAA